MSDSVRPLAIKGGTGGVYGMVQEGDKEQKKVITR